MWLVSLTAAAAYAAMRYMWKSADKTGKPGFVPIQELPPELKYDTQIEYELDKGVMLESKAVIKGFRRTADRSKAEINGTSVMAIVIADQAFQKCAELKSVYLADCVERIGYEAFYGCTALTDVRLPNGLKQIPSGCFRECTSLTHIDIPDTVIEIRACTFVDSGLQTLTLPDSVTTIALSAFGRCKSLTDVKFSKNLKTIRSGVFEGTDSLGYAELPDSLEVMEQRAFFASGLLGINIPPKLTEIKQWTFHDCKRLKEIYIPDNITGICEGAFGGCEALESVRLPRGVDVDVTAFGDCHSLRSITVGNVTVTRPMLSLPKIVGEFISFIVSRLNSGFWGKDNSAEENHYGKDAMLSLAFQLWEYGFAGITEYLTADMGLSLERAVILDCPAAFDRLTELGGRLTAEQTDEYIERAADRGENELYLSLIHYKCDILGYGTEGTVAERFEL